MWGMDLALDDAARTPDGVSGLWLSRRLQQAGYLVMPAAAAANVLVFEPPACVAEPQVDGLIDTLDGLLGQTAPGTP